MATFGELKQEVLDILIDAPARTVAAVPRFINNALKTLQATHNYRVMQRTAQFDTVPGQRSIGAFPARWKEWRGRPFRVEQLGGVRHMDYSNSAEALLRNWSSIATGTPQVISMGDGTTDDTYGTLVVYPLPDALGDWTAGAYRLYIPYWGYVPPLSADSDENWFTEHENGSSYIAWKAASLGFIMNEDSGKAGDWLAMAKEQKTIIENEDTFSWFSAEDTLIVVDGADAQTW